MRHVATDLALITERDVRVHACHIERARERAAGADRVHISFKQLYWRAGNPEHGCLVVPLPDAISLAAYFLMLADTAVGAQRASGALDDATKEGMLEVASFVASSIQAALHGQGCSGFRVVSASCQGVRPDVRPVLPMHADSELWIARARIQIHTWPASDVLLMLPPIACAITAV